MNTEPNTTVDEPVVDRRSAIPLLSRRPDLHDLAGAPGAVLATATLGLA